MSRALGRYSCYDLLSAISLRTSWEAVSDEPCDQVEQEVDGTTMVGMLASSRYFELISEDLDDGPLAQEQLVRQREQAVVHLLNEGGELDGQQEFCYALE